MLIGLPASGKSHWCDTIVSRWREAMKPSVICEDDLIQEECERSGEGFNRVSERMLAGPNKIELKRRFNAAIGVRRDIIVDARNLTEEDRSVFLEVLPDHYQKIGILFSAPTLVLQQRLLQREEETGRHVPATMIGILQKRFQGPGRFEFDRTTHIDHLCDYA
jgi:predicted kinase